MPSTRARIFSFVVSGAYSKFCQEISPPHKNYYVQYYFSLRICSVQGPVCHNEETRGQAAKAATTWHDGDRTYIIQTKDAE